MERCKEIERFIDRCVDMEFMAMDVLKAINRDVEKEKRMDKQSAYKLIELALMEEHNEWLEGIEKAIRSVESSVDNM